jgi:hypothetical protein
MNYNEVIQKIKKLAIEYSSIEENDSGDLNDIEWIENQAEEIIIEYCEKNNYLINGFPTIKKQIPENELEVNYFCREPYQLYLDLLSQTKDDVAELMWIYTNSFWPDFYPNKQEYLLQIKHQIHSGGFYEVEL